MAYIVGKDTQDKKNPMALLAAPGAFRNIKQQLQQEQLNQATQPMFQSPIQPKKDEEQQRFRNGGVQLFVQRGPVQYFQEDG